MVKHFIFLIIILIKILNHLIESRCAARYTTTTMTMATTTPHVLLRGALVTTRFQDLSKITTTTPTINIYYICLYNTGVRLNMTAISRLDLLYIVSYTDASTHNINRFCCEHCTKNPKCNYIFSNQASDGSYICTLYHWNIPNTLTNNQLAYQIKQGYWYENKAYSSSSGTLIFPNSFIHQIWG